MTFCKKCGTEHLDDDVFCPECGANVKEEEKKHRHEQQRESEQIKEPEPPKKEEPPVPTPKKKKGQQPEKKVSPELQSFIEECRKRGFSEPDIRKELIKVGWKPAAIHEVLGGDAPKKVEAKGWPRKEEPKKEPEPPKKEEPKAPKKKDQVKQVTVGGIFRWIGRALVFTIGWLIGITFFIYGLQSLQYGPLGLIIMPLALLIIPTVRKLILNKFKLNISGGVVFIILIVLFGLMVIVESSRMNTYAPMENYDEYCYSDWECTEWSICQNDRRFRECWDNNYCYNDYDRPVEKEECKVLTRELSSGNPQPIPESVEVVRIA